VFALAFQSRLLLVEMSDGPVLDASSVAVRVEVDKLSGRTWEVAGTRN
jgi:hypothetical protein